MSFRRKILRYWQKRGKKEVRELQKRIAKSRQANVKAQNELEKTKHEIERKFKEIASQARKDKEKQLLPAFSQALKAWAGGGRKRHQGK